jgi:hypothetical protein
VNEATNVNDAEQRRAARKRFQALAERLSTIHAVGLNADLARRVHQTRLVVARACAAPTQFLQRFSPERRPRSDTGPYAAGLACRIAEVLS